jgi:hypothetical protein
VLPRQCIGQEGDGKVSSKNERQNYAGALEMGNCETYKTYQTGQQMNDRKKVNPPTMSLQLGCASRSDRVSRTCDSRLVFRSHRYQKLMTFTNSHVCE